MIAFETRRNTGRAAEGFDMAHRIPTLLRYLRGTWNVTRHGPVPEWVLETVRAQQQPAREPETAWEQAAAERAREWREQAPAGRGADRRRGRWQ